MATRKGTKTFGMIRYVWKESRHPSAVGRSGLRKKARAAWYAAIRRCHCGQDKNYSQYGARGIWVCERYRADFDNFLTDLNLPPDHEHTLDRIDSKIGYCCGRCEDCRARGVVCNVRWGHLGRAVAQQKHHGDDRVQGREKECFRVGKNNRHRPSHAEKRIQAGWPLDKAFGAPVDQRRLRKSIRFALLPSAGLLSEFWR